MRILPLVNESTGKTPSGKLILSRLVYFFSKTTSTSQHSTNQTTSQDNHKKNELLRWCNFDFNFQNDENDKQGAIAKKNAIDDSFPLKPPPSVVRILKLPEEKQEEEFDQRANAFHKLRKAGDFENPNFEKWSREMKEFRYWQAVHGNLTKLNLHRLTSMQFGVNRWYLKSIIEKIKKGENYPEKIEIVCGKGKHNDDKTSKLGPDLDIFLKEMKIDAEIPSDNSGTRYIKTDQKFFKQGGLLV